MSDRYKCRLHSKGRCGNAYWSETYCDTECKNELGNSFVKGHEVCARPSRQKDAPNRETMLERACNIYQECDANAIVVGSFCYKFLRGLGIDPDAPAPERNE